MDRNLPRMNGGFTLVESVMAVMILGIALGACVLSFSMAMRSVSTAGNQMAALHAARDEVEILRTNSFSSANLTNGTSRLFTNALVGSYSVTSVDSCTKNITVSVWYLNRIHRGYSTNTLTTSLSSTLHP